ncbi:hypothetical protein K431DRAFT_299123 [Polychaeton citri CBS 116435]|uniref:Uncharacterized protein n=1 Tax=Polychaeton citri CBS 116435 TaxID=1314669 RepID=A0A9P4UJ11_9PEZI|nr:hypothetical protein K431DRAFT_299123 [Polychaeton citri CBS 116435]
MFTVLKETFLAASRGAYLVCKMRRLGYLAGMARPYIKSIKERKFRSNSYFATKYRAVGEAGDSETSKEALPTEDEGREDDIDDSELEGGATTEKLLTSVNNKNMLALSNCRKVTLSKAF